MGPELGTPNRDQGRKHRHVESVVDENMTADDVNIFGPTRDLEERD